MAPTCRTWRPPPLIWQATDPLSAIERQLEEVFCQYDAEGNGFISAEHLPTVMAALPQARARGREGEGQGEREREGGREGEGQGEREREGGRETE
eukprot:576322-Prymnesium_polylepis.1